MRHPAPSSRVARQAELSPLLRRALVTLTAATGCALLALAGLPGSAHAETAETTVAIVSNVSAPTPATADNPTLAAFGGRPGLGLLATDFVQRLIQDPRTGPFFNGIKKQDELARNLADQFCQVLNGPCVYQGKDMKKAHEEMEVRKADFNALVEVLQQSMAARDVPFADQNRLLAKLAPMHRETINAR